tara:strand:- start:2649 stop:3299 length:651 start_codon:yes stop_codon:yes gene_type:complete
MPSDGEPTSYYEKDLILWWMENLSESDQLIKPSEVSNEMKYVINHLYALDFEQKTWDKRLKLQKLQDFEEIDLSNFEIKFISNQQKYISVKYLKESISDSDFEDLKEISDHIVYFDIYNGRIDDSMIKNLLNFKNLVKVNLKDNSITDDGIKLISGLENLEVLNLIGTSVTKKSFDAFEAFKNLKRIYLWKSGINNDEIKSFNQNQNRITLIGSVN